MIPRILATLGPSSFSQEIIQKCEREDIYLFRINLSHTPLEKVESAIRQVQGWTNVPICIDSEGAQIRNQKMEENVCFQRGGHVKIHFSEVLGDVENISFTPLNVAPQLIVGDRIRVDFDSATLRVIEKKSDHCLAVVENGGVVGSNKAADLNRHVTLDPITEKDKQAIAIARGMGIKHFALSFASGSEDVEQMRKLAGPEAVIISKVESTAGVLNLDAIISSTDEVLIDRGDLSREIPIEKIPFLQRRIIAAARSQDTPVYVATNLLETMVTTRQPSRAELNDVVSTLLMGANGLVLAAECAIGQYPVEAVQMTRRLIQQVRRWTPNSSVAEILANGKN